MTCWTSRKLSWGCLAVVLFLLFLCGEAQSPLLLIPVAAIVLLNIIQTVIFFRCPHCGRSLRTRSIRMPLYCPRCGKELLPPDQQDRHPDW